ncbi:MAG: penicillin-binding protein 2 [Campylobacterales bacterium]|nr:penicillin-binding protein 2 [Campylobacterales bacterium]
MSQFNRDKEENTGKILAIFIFIVLFFILFLTGTVKEIFSSKNKTKTTKVQKQDPFRGSIKTSDGLKIASSSDIWYFALNGKNIKEDKKELVAKLISVYTNITQQEVLYLINKNKRVVINNKLTTKEAKRLKRLSKSLDKMRAFKTFRTGDSVRRFGFEIVKTKVQKRIYPYKDLLSPALGFVSKSSGEPLSGIEKYYDETLKANKEGWIYAQKDIGGNLIYNKKLEYNPSVDGNTIILTINGKLQKKIEKILTEKKEEFEAKEVIASVMDSKTGELLAFASSNRYDPTDIKNVSFTKVSALQHYYEAGSVIKPFILSYAIEKGYVKRYDLLKGYNGRWKLGKKTIIDDVRKFNLISVENILIYSSNIGISQVGLMLNGYQMRELFTNFGISKISEIDLPFERETYLPSTDQYDRSEIYKATSSYGYGLQTNFVQLLKAYNIFNNGGYSVNPHIAKTIFTNNNERIDAPITSKKVLSRDTATTIKSILRKTVKKGTGVKANIEGYYIAGKTGTAHIAKKGSYSDSYMNSFFGFANDDKRKYTLGVVFVEPNPEINHFSSKTAAPTGKRIIEVMIEEELLEKKSEN